MNKTISNITASISIMISILTYLSIFFIMQGSHTSSQGWVEFFTLISSVFFILNGLCLATILNGMAKPMLYISLTVYFLIGIIPIAIENYFTLIPTTIVSIVIMLVSIKLITKVSRKQSLGTNGLILVLNCIWGWLMIGV